MAELILLTGATGYVGGRLLPRLEAAGRRVRCLARRPDAVAAGPATEVTAGDVLEPETLGPAFRGVSVAYYLIHSMGSSGSFEETDRQAALNFGAAARAAGVQRIVYLGGLGSEREELSAHLRSRHEVGEILRESGVPVTEFRASIVIGAGSLSFEMIRALVDRLPVMITPRWVNVPAQPIAIDDLLHYLVAALDLPVGADRTFEIGGADVVSYADIMRTYADVSGRSIRMLPVPVLTPWLSSLWLGLVTPLYARIGRKLIESIVHSTIVHDDAARRSFDLDPVGVEAAVRDALEEEAREEVASRWHGAESSAGPRRTWDDSRFGSRLIDERSTHVDVAPETAWAPIARIGGRNGWYGWDLLWRLRGALDLLVGGVGMRRGRAARLRPGDALDFWRVEAIQPGRTLRLVAEMKLPGRAWLQFDVVPEGSGSRITQTALFDPVGAAGRAYWYGLIPVHSLVFAGMLRGIARAAEDEADDY